MKSSVQLSIWLPRDLDMGGQFLRDLTLYGNANCHNILGGFLKVVQEEFVGACLLCSHLTFARFNFKSFLSSYFLIAGNFDRLKD